MRPFCLTVAFLTFVGGVGCVAIVSNLERVYQEMNAPLSIVAKIFVATSGWIPGGILVTLAVLVAVFVALGKDKVSLYLAVVVLLILICAAIVVPVVLMAPFSEVVRNIDAAAIKKRSIPALHSPQTDPLDGFSNAGGGTT